MKKSRVLTLGLACFFAAVTAFSTLAATSAGGGAFYSHLNDVSRNETASSQNFSQTDEKSAHDAAILSGEGLGLDPENDPVVYTTDWGLDIKFHADWGTFGTSAATGVSGYTYFTMGSYGGTNINWVIIGYRDITWWNSSSLDNVQIPTWIKMTNRDYVNYYNSNIKDSTPAGSAITSDSSKQYVRDYGYYFFSTNAKQSNEIPSGCVLCFAEKSITRSTFTSVTTINSSNWASTSNYAASTCTLRTLINGFCTTSSSTLGFTAAQIAKIQPQKLYTAYCSIGAPYGESSRTASLTTLSNQYLFPLTSDTMGGTDYGSSSKFSNWSNLTNANYYAQQNFKIEDYLTASTAKTPLYDGNGYAYFLRGGGLSYKSSSEYRPCIQGIRVSDGYMFTSNMWNPTTQDVRPAFVLKIN